TGHDDVGPRAVDDDLFVDPVRSRVREVVTEARPRGQLPAAHDPGAHQRPRPVTDHADRRAGFHHSPYEADDVAVGPQLIRIGDAAGKNQCVVVDGVRTEHCGVDIESLGGRQVVETLD